MDYLFKPSIAFLALVALATMICTSSTPAAADDALPTARIAKYSADRDAAISYTFDDNLRDQYTLAVPMLNEFGFKGTFFVIAGATAETPEEGQKKQNLKRAWGGISWPELKEIAAQGHEIGSHTWSHPNLTKLSPEEVDAQFTKANDAIKEHIGSAPLTLAFPFNARTPAIEAAALKYYVAFRSHQTATSGKSTPASLNDWADKLVKDKNWGVIMAHGVGEGYSALSDPEILRAQFKYVQSRESEIWVDTFANVARYEKERDDAKLSLSGKSGNISCSLTSTLDPQIYNVPLTIVLDAKGAKSVRATRDGKELPACVQSDSIYVDAAPGTSPITISWKTP